jgi:hypothetical protein
MLASWCGCEVFDFVVLAADAIEQLPAVGHPTKVSRSKWPLGKAVVSKWRSDGVKLTPQSPATDLINPSVTHYVAGDQDSFVRGLHEQASCAPRGTGAAQS